MAKEDTKLGGCPTGVARRDFLTAAVASSTLTLSGCVASGKQGAGPRGPAPAPAPGAARLAPSDHFLDAEVTHNRWNRDLKPRLRMRSGQTVTVQTREASDGHFTPSSTTADVATRDRSRVHPLTGPIFVEEAAPGDTLQIDILDHALPDWGWTCISPPAGFLGDAFTSNFLHIWRFDRARRFAELKPGVRVPITRPFLGVIGLAWDEAGDFRTFPPRPSGGNMDIKHLTAGTSLYLPVTVPGAMLSVGDGHAAQGDGEVCVSAIECDLTTRLRVTVRKSLRIAAPHYESRQFHATTGIATSIDAAAKDATRAMIDYLATWHHMSREEAYVLCSVAMDLKICETVDMPNYLVSAHLPVALLGKGAHPW